MDKIFVYFVDRMIMVVCLQPMKTNVKIAHKIVNFVSRDHKIKFKT